jgi:hypothetical protein
MEQNKNQVLPGTLNLMILKTPETLGPLHGYGIARRIEQISADRFQLNHRCIPGTSPHWGYHCFQVVISN